MNRAACKGMDPDIFIIDNHSSGAKALEVCSRCEVRQECFEYAMAHPKLSGIWGGTKNKTRIILRRELRRAARDT